MATQVQNALAVINALADSLGKTVTPQKAADIVEEFINEIAGPATNEEKATQFNAMLVQLIRSTGRSHKGQTAGPGAQALIDAASDDATSNF